MPLNFNRNQASIPLYLGINAIDLIIISRTHIVLRDINAIRKLESLSQGRFSGKGACPRIVSRQLR